jgi:hypothetical protein
MSAVKVDADLFGKPFFGDSRLDRMMGIIFALAGEVAVLKSDVARLSGQATDENAIDAEMQRLAREVLKPLVDPDFDAAVR